MGESSSDRPDAYLQQARAGEAETPEPYPFALRLGMVLICAAIRFGGQSGICANMYFADGVPLGSAPTTVIELLLVMVMLEDGQGLLTLLLFGLRSQNVALLRSCLVRTKPRPVTQGQEDAEPASPSAAARQAARRQDQHILDAYVYAETQSSSDDSDRAEAARAAQDAPVAPQPRSTVQ